MPPEEVGGEAMSDDVDNKKVENDRCDLANGKCDGDQAWFLEKQIKSNKSRPASLNIFV
jgi:hypothetical protein